MARATDIAFEDVKPFPAAVKTFEDYSLAGWGKTATEQTFISQGWLGCTIRFSGGGSSACFRYPEDAHKCPVYAPQWLKDEYNHAQ